MNQPIKPKRVQLIEILDEMVKNYEALPQSAMMQPIVHYDHQSLLLLLQAFFKAED
jgi:hypothetical protein